MQAIASDGELVHCSVFRAQGAHSSNRSLEGRRGEVHLPGKSKVSGERSRKLSLLTFFLERK